MALRIRKDGRILCAATHAQEKDDVYLNDDIHYSLSVELKQLVTEPMESILGRGGHIKHGEWWWRNQVPPDVVIDEFYNK